MEMERFYKTYNEISKSLLYDIITEKEGQNAVISPMSVIALLGIAAASTEGDTSNEIVQYLKAENKEELLSCISEMIKIIKDSSSTESASVVIAAEKVRDMIRPEYIKMISKLFDAGFISSENMVEDINKWVKKKTKGMITNIADDSVNNTLAALINAVTFISDWSKKYKEDDIGPSEFTNADGTVSEPEMMSSTEKLYVENEYYTGFIKDYKDKAFSFMALLPKKKRSKTFFKRALYSSDISDLYKNAQSIKVYATMPEFTIDHTENLKTLLERKGIENIFTDSADFSPMAANTPLKIDSITHKAHIEVDRRGTKAAVVTYSYVVAGGAPMMDEYKSVVLDRPFVYTIIHRKTGLPIFIGTVQNL